MQSRSMTAARREHDTLRSHEIARQVRYDRGHWIELSDTRLLPGQSAAIELNWDGSDRIKPGSRSFRTTFTRATSSRTSLRQCSRTAILGD